MEDSVTSQNEAYDSVQQDFFRKRHENAGGQVRHFWRTLVNQTREYCLQHGKNADEFHTCMLDADGFYSEFVDSLLGLPPVDGELKEPDLLWKKFSMYEVGLKDLRDLADARGGMGSLRDLPSLVDRLYIGKEWLWNDYVTFMMIDAMLLQEVTATGEYLRGTNAFGVHQLSEAFTHKFTGSRLLDISVRVWRLFWFIAPHAVAAAAVYYMIVVGVIKLAGVFLAIWALYAMFVYWASRSKRKLRRLFAEMVGLYRRFHGPILSPTRFQHELYKVADQGAIFDPAVFALTEEAIRRNPTTLRGLRSGEFQGWGLYE